MRDDYLSWFEELHCRQKRVAILRMGRYENLSGFRINTKNHNEMRCFSISVFVNPGSEASWSKTITSNPSYPLDYICYSKLLNYPWISFTTWSKLSCRVSNHWESLTLTPSSDFSRGSPDLDNMWCCQWESWDSEWDGMPVWLQPDGDMLTTMIDKVKHPPTSLFLTTESLICLQPIHKKPSQVTTCW